MLTEKLCIVVPVYNEELAVEFGVNKLLDVLNDLIAKSKITPNSYILLVNDGSKDNTWAIIEQLVKKNNGRVTAISLASNTGKENAMLCGYHNVEADMCISIDIDLQDDISKIEEMVDLYYQGNHVIYGVRSNRDSDSMFKRLSAQMYYKIISLFNVETIKNVADFRLMSNFALKILKEFGETNLYLRGIIASMGLKSANVYYARLSRELGDTKYTLVKLLQLAFNGIFSMSSRPLLLIHLLSLIFLLISVAIFVYIIISILFFNTSSGWASILASIYLVGGALMLSMSLLAAYISRIYSEVKKRPLYIIEKKLD